MADISDVEKAIVTKVSAALYPNGTSQPSIITAPCKVMRGWPVPKQLDTDLDTGILTISVFPMPMERNTTRFTTDLQTLNIPTPTITATISGQTITFAGTIGSTQNIGVTVGSWQSTSETVVYPATTSDTMTTVATGLAALLVGAGIAATSSGPVLTLPPSAIVTAAVGVFGTVWQEFKRQERAVMVSLWCPNPAMRDQAAPIIDLALVKNEHLLLPDGSGARMVYQRTMISDERQTLEIYRRDFVYMVEYGTNEITTYPQIISTIAITTT
ncbi:hypothetical protein A6U86_05475 [Rhizobium sp. AC27/96]|uniref:hypothetical protein n=1 Tax=Rhizobium sp. AC27/96 TaxID=1841653 RepID=UPI000827B31E|nr:hypothetical protein [Rhizobium sp. AC27/96]OCJ12473.1 hypothetical protein A6U86_05475 [Rhizobium sp. AC27/96]